MTKKQEKPIENVKPKSESLTKKYTVELNSRQIFYLLNIVKRSNKEADKFLKNMSYEQFELAFGIEKKELDELQKHLHDLHKTNVKEIDEDIKKQIDEYYKRNNPSVSGVVDAKGNPIITKKS